MENKLNLKKDINDQLELANERNKQKLMERYNNQQELVQLNNERALKEIMKEESYRKVKNDFFFHFILFVFLKK